MIQLILAALFGVAAATPRPAHINNTIAAQIDQLQLQQQPTAQSLLQLEQTIAGCHQAELCQALAIVRARLIEKQTGPKQALKSLAGLRYKGLLAAALADEKLRLALIADQHSTALAILRGRLNAKSKRTRSKVALEYFGVAQRSPHTQQKKAAQALNQSGNTNLALLLQAHWQLNRNKRSAALKHLFTAAEQATKPEVLRALDDFLLDNNLTQPLVKKLKQNKTGKLADKLANSGRAQRALDLLALLPQSNQLLPIKMRAYLAQRDFARALDMANAILADPKSPAHAVAALERARMLSRLGRSAQARQAYTDFANTYKKDPQAEQAAFFAAWILHEGGHAKPAAQAFAAYLKARPGSQMSGKARWLWAFNLYRDGQLQQSITAMDQVLTTTTNAEETILARYFRARALGQLGFVGEARQVFTDLASSAEVRDKSPYYRAMARSALVDLGSTEVSHGAIPRCGVLATIPGISAQVGLSGVPDIHRGTDSSCPVELRQSAKQLLPLLPPAQGHALAAVATTRLCDVSARILRTMARPRDHKSLRLYLETLLLSGDATRTLRLASRSFRQHLHDPKQSPNRWQWQLAFPAPTYAKVAMDIAVPQPLRLAVARQESHFIPDAVSWVGALGMMQMMPNTGRRLAAMTGQALEDPKELLVPARNVPLGSFYLSLLQQELNGELPLMAAAYNAGPHRVVEWLERFHAMPLDEFVESIPYLETRGYVKKVMSAYTVYAWLEGHPDPEHWATMRCLDARTARLVDF